MPPTTGAPITPQLGRMPPLFAPTSDRRGKAVLTFITLTLIVSAIFVRFDSKTIGSVTVLVRAEGGTRTVSTLHIGSGALSERADIDPSVITTQTLREFNLLDGSTITLDSSGVVQRIGTIVESTRVLIASPVAPLVKTPLAIWNEGERIAWSSPADGSTQVFELSERGSYMPLLLNDSLRANSLDFLEDGSVLVIARIVGYKGDQTDIYTVQLDSGEVVKVATLNGQVSIIPAP